MHYKYVGLDEAHEMCILKECKSSNEIETNQGQHGKGCSLL